MPKSIAVFLLGAALLPPLAAFAGWTPARRANEAQTGIRYELLDGRIDSKIAWPYPACRPEVILTTDPNFAQLLAQ